MAAKEFFQISSLAMAGDDSLLQMSRCSYPRSGLLAERIAIQGGSARGAPINIKQSHCDKYTLIQSFQSL